MRFAIDPGVCVVLIICVCEKSYVFFLRYAVADAAYLVLVAILVPNDLGISGS